MGAAVLATGTLPWSVPLLYANDPRTPPAAAPRVVEGLASSALASSYGLGVVEVPEPPVFQATAASELFDCPVELRGVVQAEAGENAAEVELDEAGEPLAAVGGAGFAVLADGADSWLLGPGQGVYTARGYLRVTAVETDAVVMQFAGGTHRCRLIGGAR